MSKFRYSEWTMIRQNIQTARLSILEKLTNYQKAVATFQDEKGLSGATWNAAKNYMGASAPLAKGLYNVLVETADAIDSYLTDFEGSVGQTGKDLDSSKLEGLEQDLNRTKKQKNQVLEAIKQTTSKLADSMMPLGSSTGLSTATFDSAISDYQEEIELLKKYKEFEARHKSDFSSIVAGMASIQKGLEALGNPANFNSSTGTFTATDFSKEEWYEEVDQFNAVAPPDRVDIQKRYVEIKDKNGRTLGYQTVYDVYINGVVSEEASAKYAEMVKEAGLKELGEVLGVNDLIRAFGGIDPLTGEKITNGERAKAAFLSLLWILPLGEGAKVLSNIKKGVAALEGVEGATDLLRLKNLSNSSVLKTIEESGMTVEQFNILKLKPSGSLTPSEAAKLKAIRDAQSGITDATTIQKTIPVRDIQNYLGGNFDQLGGYVAKSEDMAKINAYTDVRESLRLDYKYVDRNGTTVKPFPEGLDKYGTIEFKTNATDKIEVPYDAVFWGNSTTGYPATGNGFTASRNGVVIPEYEFNDRIAIPDGATISINNNGKKELIGIYRKSEGKFIRVKGN